MAKLLIENMKLNFLGDEVKRVTVFNSNPEIQCQLLEEIIQELKCEIEEIKLRSIRKKSSQNL
ncbi:hypothetical protein NMS92_003543 [Vibrio cholerae]|nr:hypothetical protein [Vibrio cholerae]